MNYVDGSKYIGSYVNERKHGYGEYYWPDGTYYKGYYFEGKEDGEGLYRDKSGIEKMYEWK